jgi:hypothetical protein
MLICHIHVTSDNYIIEGVREPGPYTPTGKSTRALLIFGMDGKQQHTYQYDSNKHRLFTKMHWKPSLYYNSDTIFFPHRPYILFIERRVPVFR